MNNVRQPDAVFGLVTLPGCSRASIAVHRRTTGLGLPGGFVKSGESAEQALVRKLREELGDGDPVIGRQLYQAVVNDQLIRTYDVVLQQAEVVKDWATPDELIESQARKPLAHYNLSVLISAGIPLSSFSASAWISALGSGTLQYSVDSAYSRELYIHERTALELGEKWEAVVPSRIIRGKALAMGDTPQWTEALWFARHVRFGGPAALCLKDLAPEWVALTEDEGRWEGLALLAQPDGLPWWPAGRVAVAKLATWNTSAGKWA